MGRAEDVLAVLPQVQQKGLVRHQERVDFDPELLGQIRDHRSLFDDLRVCQWDRLVRGGRLP